MDTEISQSADTIEITLLDLAREMSESEASQPVTVSELKEQLMVIRRIAISLVHTTENLLQLPEGKRAIRTREERRNES